MKWSIQGRRRRRRIQGKRAAPNEDRVSRACGNERAACRRDDRVTGFASDGGDPSGRSAVGPRSWPPWAAVDRPDTLHVVVATRRRLLPCHRPVGRHRRIARRYGVALVRLAPSAASGEHDKQSSKGDPGVLHIPRRRRPSVLRATMDDGAAQDKTADDALADETAVSASAIGLAKRARPLEPPLRTRPSRPD